jgi:hypothetical protein
MVPKRSTLYGELSGVHAAVSIPKVKLFVLGELKSAHVASV